MWPNSVATIPDPTVDLIANMKIHPFEAVIGSALLIYSIIAETLAFLFHRFKDKNHPISRSQQIIICVKIF